VSKLDILLGNVCKSLCSRRSGGSRDPQHPRQMDLPVRIFHVVDYSPPATGTGLRRVVVVPSPSAPSALWPQQ
jgi:hypothetical protein